MQLTPCQEKALTLLEGWENVFLTGVAGSGKSFLLQHFLKDKARKHHPVVASTGAAAVLVRGVTFHSFFALGILEGGVEKTVQRAIKDRRLKKRLRDTLTLVIDEVSMIPGAALEAAEIICRMVRDKPLPWGGIKVIAVGDFGQLPPVTLYGQRKDWAFLSPVWQSSQFRVAYLRTVMRSRDAEFLEVLNSIREGDVTQKVRDFLNSKLALAQDDFDGTRLFSHRIAAEEHNLKQLARLPGENLEYATRYVGPERFLNQIKKSAPVPEVLHLKRGALVMIRKNDPDRQFVNGSLGHVIDVAHGVLEIELLNGRRIELEPESFSLLDAEGEEIAVAENFPVNLAWATTIHKSQGMTIDRAAIDLSKVFEEGQAYVALSRMQSADGLVLTGWNPRAIRASEEVKAFHGGL